MTSKAADHLSSPPKSQPSTPAPDPQEADQSDSSSESHHTTRPNLSSVMDTSSTDHMGFGTPIQKFTQELTKSLARFTISKNLTNKNFMRQSQPVMEALMSLDYLPYIKKKSYRDSNLTDEQHTKVKLILTTQIINLLDAENVQRSCVHLTVRSQTQDTDSYDNEDEEREEELAINYGLALLWKSLKSHHQPISESSLTVIYTTLHNMKISPSDSLVVHTEKFNNMMLNFYQYCGKMLNVQSDQLLIKTIGDRFTETTKELIYQTVKPLTRQGVSDQLKEYELRNGGFPTAATREANFATTTLPLAAQSTSRSGRVKCTKDKCVGFQHKPEECFSKPQNFKKRDAWITKKEAESGNHSYQPKASQISGMKDVYDPVASFTETNL